MTVFLQPPSLDPPQRYFKETADRFVTVERIAPYLSGPTYDQIKRDFPDERVRLWGAVPGRSNTPLFEQIQAGDLVLFYRPRRIIYGMTVAATLPHARSLAVELWGTDRGGRAWEHVYVPRTRHCLDIPYEELWEIVKYGPKDGLPGLLKLDDVTSKKVMDSYLSLSHPLDDGDGIDRIEDKILRGGDMRGLGPVSRPPGDAVPDRRPAAPDPDPDPAEVAPDAHEGVDPEKSSAITSETKDSRLGESHGYRRDPADVSQSAFTDDRPSFHAPDMHAPDMHAPRPPEAPDYRPAASREEPDTSDPHQGAASREDPPIPLGFDGPASGPRPGGYDLPPSAWAGGPRLSTEQAVHRHATSIAERFFALEGYVVSSLSQHSAAHLYCERRDGAHIVFVRGMTEGFPAVDLPNPIMAALSDPSRRITLFVLHGLEVQSMHGEVFVSGGTIHVERDWRPGGDRLVPTAYQYRPAY